MNKLILGIVAGAAAGFFICKIKNKANMLKAGESATGLKQKSRKI